MRTHPPSQEAMSRKTTNQAGTCRTLTHALPFGHGWVGPIEMDGLAGWCHGEAYVFDGILYHLGHVFLGERALRQAAQDGLA